LPCFLAAILIQSCRQAGLVGAEGIVAAYTLPPFAALWLAAFAAFTFR